MAKGIQLSDHQTKPAISSEYAGNGKMTVAPGCFLCLFIADIDRKLRPVSSMWFLTCKTTPKNSRILASHPVIVKTTTGLVSWWNEQHLVPRACNLCGKCRPAHIQGAWKNPSKFTGDLGINAPIAWRPCHLMKLPQLRESSVTTCRSHKWTETYWNNKALRHT